MVRQGFSGWPVCHAGNGTILVYLVRRCDVYSSLYDRKQLWRDFLNYDNVFISVTVVYFITVVVIV